MRLPRGTFGISAVVGVLIAAGCAGGAVAGSSGTGGSSQLRAPRPVRTLRPVRRPHRRRTSGARRPVPILMYHDIGPVPAGEPYPELFTAPAVFRTELRALARRGYHAVTLGRVIRAWHRRASLPRRPVVLSFDDGFRGIWSAALPALRARRWPGVLFLLLRHLDRPGRWDLSSAQVRQLLAAGWELDAHGFSEVDLTAIPSRAAWHIVHRSRMRLRRGFHVPVSFYCYPVGAYDGRIIRLVRRAGYEGAVTTAEGYARPGGDPFALPRIRVNGNESPAALLASLRAAAG